VGDELPTSMTRALPTRLRPALLIAAFVALLAPTASVAAGQPRAHSSAHKRVAHRACAATGRKSARRARRSSHACARRRTASRKLTATPLTTGAVAAGEPTGASHTHPAPPKPAGGTAGPGPGNLPIEAGETVTDPIDPRFLTDAPFGKRSFWLQPWRAYMDTWPASRLTESLGINFPEDPALADNTAQLLADSGFKLARIAISWAALSYEDPSTFLASHLASITTRLTAMHNHGLRPLIVLNANSGAPTPELQTTLETVAPVPAGAQTVTLSASSAARVVPGRTGFSNVTFGGGPDDLITKVGAGNVATLSRPLKVALAAGRHGGVTLRYAPFQTPIHRADGSTSPVFAETLGGWLKYVGAVNRLASSILGPGGYDLEVWNELSFGSQFLNTENYYSQPTEIASEPEPTLGIPTTAIGTEAEQDAIAETSVEAQNDSEAEDETESSESSRVENTAGVAGASGTASATAPSSKRIKKLHTKEVIKAVLAETVAYVRNPANGISTGVGVTNGFASQTPFPSGANAPLGMTALSKHPYVGAKQFPEDFRKGHIRPIHALGGRDTTDNSSFEPLFIPSFQTDFPEYTLNAISTETSIRDLAPFTTDVYGYPHGREVGPAGGSAVQKWITEFNLSSHAGHTVGPDESTPATGVSAELTPADKAHFQAKVALRSLVAEVGKGFSREYFYKAAPGSLSLIDQAFFTAAEAHPESFPGDQLGGETMDGLRNLLSQFQGPGPSGAARQLELRSITQHGNHAQFAGDGSVYHPSLYDRNVLAVLPFQSSPTRFVIPVYVMTRDLKTLYEPLAPGSDVHRFDLPQETFTITLANLPETAGAPSVTAYDPLLGASTPAALVSRSGSGATFEIAATDYPRLLTLDYTGK
jgi:hypothetical protein